MTHALQFYAMERKAVQLAESDAGDETGRILRLAKIIRDVDGNHDKGAAALAEAILSHPDIRSVGLGAEPVAPPFEGEVDALIKILDRIARMLDFMPDGPPQGTAVRRVIELLQHRYPAPAPGPAR